TSPCAAAASAAVHNPSHPAKGWDPASSPLEVLSDSVSTVWRFLHGLKCRKNPLILSQIPSDIPAVDNPSPRWQHKKSSVPLLLGIPAYRQDLPPYAVHSTPDRFPRYRHPIGNPLFLIPQRYGILLSD